MDRIDVTIMNSSILRQVWSVIEETQSNLLLTLNDRDLVKGLLKQLDSNNTFSDEEANLMTAYLYSKTTLIRDIAEARLLF